MLARLGKGPKARSGGRGRGRKVTLFTRIDPATGAVKRVTKEDVEYDLWLTPTQYRAQQGKAASAAAAKAEKAAEAQASLKATFAKEALKGVGLAVPGRTTAAARRAVARKAATAGAKVGGLVRGAAPKIAAAAAGLGPVGLSIAAAAVAIGAAWWIKGKIDLKRKVEAEIEKSQRMLGRPYTEQELKLLLPQYKAWFAKH